MGHGTVMHQITIYIFFLLIHSRVVPDLTKHHGTNYRLSERLHEVVSCNSTLRLQFQGHAKELQYLPGDF